MALEGKVAIVTGAAHGIGLACARRLASDGAKVVLADMDEEAGRKAVDGIVSSGGVASFVSCDVGDRLDVHNLVAHTIDNYDGIDILINNAGIAETADFLEITEEQFDKVIRVNLKGALLVGQAVAKQMVKAFEDDGKVRSIINMSSINERVALPDQVPYCVSKGGLAQLTKVMALSLAQRGVRVNAVGPGSIMTEMLQKVVLSNDGAKKKILRRTPMGRAGDPSEIASVCSFLASDDASYITGQTLYADGGRLALNYTVPLD